MWTDKRLTVLTHPPSSYRWISPLHRVVCYLESPKKNPNDSRLTGKLFCVSLSFISHSIQFFIAPLNISPPPSAHFSSFISSSSALHLLLLTRLSLCSLLVQASMKVWAMTDSEASTTSDTWTSKMKWGFLRMFTQNLKGRLRWSKWGTTHHSYYSRYRYRMWKNLAITSVNSFTSGKRFMWKSTWERCNWVHYKVITGMEESLSCRCQFIQNNILYCHFILVFHIRLTFVGISAVQIK